MCPIRLPAQGVGGIGETGRDVIVSTLNRNPRAFAVAIVARKYLPRLAARHA